MWIEHVFLGFLGLVCGLSVASGSFAIAVKLGIIPQMANKSGTAKHIMTYENVVILGGISGNLFSVFPDIRFPAGHVLLGLFGFASMWLAVFADTGVAMLCILNSVRILYQK